MPFAVRFSDLAHSTELYIVGKWHPIIWAGWILCRFISDQFYSHVALDHEGGPSFLWSFYQVCVAHRRGPFFKSCKLSISLKFDNWCVWSLSVKYEAIIACGACTKLLE
jgi:hypothetical protein